MCKNSERYVLRFEAIKSLMKAERIDIEDTANVIKSLQETVQSKANIDCYLHMILIGEHNK